MKRTNLSSQYIPLNDDELGDEATLNRARFQILYQLSQMYDESEEVIKDFALEAAVKMTRSKFGYIYFMNEDETLLSLHAWSKDVMSQCTVMEPQTEYLVADTGLWGEAARQRRPVITNDYSDPDLHKKGIPPGHVPINKHMSLPLIEGDKIVLLAGVANKQTLYDETDIQHLTLVMDSMWRLVKQKRMAAALEESEARYRAIFDQSVDAIAIVDAETGAIVAFNDKIHTMLGYTREAFSQLTIADVEADTSPAQIAAHLRKIRETGHDIYETFHKTRDGETRNVVVNAQLIQVNGQPLIQAVLTDITERKKAEETLRQLSQAVEQSPVSIVITDPDGVIEYVNPKFSQITGYTLEEAVGQTPAILKSWATTQEEYAHLWQTISQGHEWRGEFYNRRKDGTHYWEMASISPIFNENQEITHYLGVKEDITDRKLLGEQLQRSNNELRLLNRAGQAISSTLDVNQVMAILLDETRGLLKISAGAVWVLDDESDELVCQQVTGHKMQALLELRHVADKGNSVGWVALNGKSRCIPDIRQADITAFPTNRQDIGFEPRSCLAVPLQIKKKVIGVFQILDKEADRFTEHETRLIESLATFAANAVENARLHKNLQNQLTRLYDAQSRLIQSEKLAAVGELIAGVAHELNNPLASTILYAQLLQRKATDEALANDLGQIVTQARRASGIVRGLLDFARQRAPEWGPTQVNQLLQNTLDFHAYELNTHNVNVFTQFSPKVPMTMADPHQLQQVFVNLIHNALQALDKKRSGNRHLTLSTECGPSQYYAGTKSLASVIRIIVQDNGPGIPPEFISRIFDPFVTTKSPGEGTGLGLSVCHGIIAKHEGHIWVESQEHQGSTFFIELPIIVPDSPPGGSDEAGVSVQEKQFRPANILIVDDEESLLTIIAHILRHKGYHVDGVNSGEVALTYLAERDYDLILSDLRMPGMSGIELYRQAARLYPQIKGKIIFTTGDTISRGTQEFLDEIGAPYLSKPFESSDLITAVQEQIELTMK
jgi:PAS domain S-box-containing protein